MTELSSKAPKFDSSSCGIGRVVKWFLAWKFVLLVVACASPGPGYDTSTQILLDQYAPPSTSTFGGVAEHIVLRLTRWDGIYFSVPATRGHLNEQEWAFSWTLARITSFVTRVFLSSTPLSAIVKHALAGILISNLSHLFAVALLYQLTFNLVPSSNAIKRQVAFLTACLHVMSPAGLFLSAPYGESTFALLNFAGTLSYVLAAKARNPTSRNAAGVSSWIILAGACFGAATMIRGNGLLSGIIFAWDAIEAILHPSHLLHDFKAMSRFAATILAGILVAVGFVAPQVVAYMEYCTAGNTRPWCTRVPPSIYSWVQEHYWEVGLFRYWTLNNLPLFLLAGPMLGMLLFTASIALTRPEKVARACSLRHERKELDAEQKVFSRVLPRLALPQLVLAVMAATSFHVQIINRISSGYPVWDIILAIAIYNLGETPKSSSSNYKKETPGQLAASSKTSNSWHWSLLKERHLQWIVRTMAMYAVVQGGLYASFLPPA